jgi:hypothetical protein
MESKDGGVCARHWLEANAQHTKSNGKARGMFLRYAVASSSSINPAAATSSLIRDFRCAIAETQ